MTLQATILGISVWGPGLDGWEASRPILAGAAPWIPREAAPPPAPLPQAERRRSGPVVRLALAAAQESARTSQVDPSALRHVFASSTGDGPIVGAILDALSGPGDRVVSPTQFHNSVHNAPAGYWSIAVANRQPATCLGCHDDTFAAGLLTALTEQRAAATTCSGSAVLFCCYDYPLPPPLDAVRDVGPPFACALVLGQGAGPCLLADYSPDPADATPFAHDLAGLAAASPAGRGLPLLAALAAAQARRIVLPYLGGSLTLEVSP